MLTKIQNIGTIYFLSFLGGRILNWIIILEIDTLFTSILSFTVRLVEFPKNIIDLFIMYLGLNHYLIPISFIFFLKTIYDLIWGRGLEF